MSHTFDKDRRLLLSADFSRTIREGHCVSDNTLVLYALRSRPGRIRIGVTIPKKMGGAVIRNRWKRLIREAFRLQSALIPSGHDYVIRPKKGAQPDWNRIKRSLPQLAARAAQR